MEMRDKPSVYTFVCTKKCDKDECYAVMVRKVITLAPDPPIQCLYTSQKPDWVRKEDSDVR